jgi:hypothetical protein
MRVRETGRYVCDADLEAGRMSIRLWQPDFVAVSFRAQKIAILELCRPSDTSPEHLQAAYDRKLRLYGPLVDALSHYIDSGWSVKILPWVVGARGLVQERSLHHALEYLEIPRGTWLSIIEDTVLASISALAFMHRVRFSPPALRVPETRDTNLMMSKVEDSLWRGTKRKTSSMLEDPGTVMVRWKKMATNPQEQQATGGGADATT